MGMAFETVPAGEFTMGRKTDDPAGRFWEELPLRQITISRPFQMARVEVSNSNYERFDPDHKRSSDLAVDGDDEPVALVSWLDARAFLIWLNATHPSEKAGMVYGLPTEAQCL